MTKTVESVKVEQKEMEIIEEKMEIPVEQNKSNEEEVGNKRKESPVKVEAKKGKKEKI